MANLAPGTVIGRYALFDALASGGMATVHVGRLMGPVGFARTVAIKRLHPQFSRDPEFVSMFLDEARMCARIRHPNVVPTLDVVADGGELFLVMEYIQGESLSHLVKGLQTRGERMPWRVALAIVVGALHGLHAAHESKDERGVALGLVHRDVSPQNILVGTDGMARVLDFGIAKAAGRTQTTREGAVKGKLGYMAPEQMAAESISRQADLYAAAVVLWELVAGRRLFDGDSETVILAKVLTAPVDPPSKYAPDLPKELDEIVMKGINRKVSARYTSAREFALALEKLGPAALGEVAEWLESVAAPALSARQQLLSLIETGTSTGEHELRNLATAIEDPRSQSQLTIEPALSEEAASPADLPRDAARKRAFAIGGATLFIALGALMLYVAVRADASGAASPGADALAQPASQVPSVAGASAPDASALGSLVDASSSSARGATASAPSAEPTAEPSAQASASAQPSASAAKPGITSRVPGPMPKPGTGTTTSPFKGLGGRE
jgi:eukaryotic-like serine/threonine-protein kinase